MRITSQLSTRASKSSSRAIRSKIPFQLIKGSFSPGKVARQSPLLGNLHRAIDGATLGVLVAVALMSALTLHWQHLWTVAFTRLEITRNLSHRLIESTALLEQHLLRRASLPKSLVLTKATDLIYLNRSYVDGHLSKQSNKRLVVLGDVSHNLSNYGY